MFKPLCIAVALLMLVASPLTAQTTQPGAEGDSPETTAVKTAAKEFMTALQDKDANTAKKLFAGTDEDWKLVEIMHSVFQSGMRLQAAAEKRWPEEMKAQKKSDDFDPKAMAARIDRDTVTITGDTAKFASGTVLKKTDGAWKVTDMVGDPMGKGLVSGMLSTIAPVFAEAADEVENGKYESFAEAQDGIRKKMQAKMSSRMGGAAPRQPSTMPAE